MGTQRQSLSHPPRRFLALALPVTLAFSAAACAHQPDDTDYFPDCPGLTSATAADQNNSRRGQPYETSTYTFIVVGNARLWDDDSVFDQAQSPEWRATVSVGPWVRGSDQAGLDDAWSKVSDIGTMPLPSGPYGETGRVTGGVGEYDVSKAGKFYACLDSQKAAYIFGTITFEDVTEFSKPLPDGYERPDYPNSYEVQDVSLELAPGSGRDGIPSFFGCYERRCGHSKKGRESDELELPIIHSYSDDNHEGGAGPHPFVVAVPDAFTSDSESLVVDSVLHLTRLDPIEQDGNHGNFGVDIPTALGW